MKNRMRLNRDNLKDSILQKRIKKINLAQEIGVTRETLSRWLAGKSEYIDEEKLIRLSEVLSCDLSWLSPEVPRTIPKSTPVFNSVTAISGDDFIKLGVFSGQWQDVSLLYEHSRHPEIIQDHEVNGLLFRILSSLMVLDFTAVRQQIKESPIAIMKHERFDVMARAALSQGIMQFISGDIGNAQQNFKRVIIQGQAEWLVAFAHLLSALCDGLQSSADEIRRGLEGVLPIFSNSKDELTNFIIANIHLILCAIQAERSPDKAWQHLENARKIFETIGFRNGQLRCMAYEALCISYQNRTEKAQGRWDKALADLRTMPQLFRLETLFIYALSMKDSGHAEMSFQFLTMADDLAKQSDLLSYLIKSKILELMPSNSQLSDQVQKVKPRFEAPGAEALQWRAR